jgi:hypothetical protein
MRINKRILTLKSTNLFLDNSNPKMTPKPAPALFFLTLLLCAHFSLNLSCLDTQGKPLGYYTGLRLNGAQRDYIYISDQKSSSFQATDETLMQVLLQQVDLNKHSVTMYNDQPPTASQPSNCAHAKGVLVWD